MKITVINGIKDINHDPFEMQLELALIKLQDEHKVDLFTIADMDINYCCGCFGCWVKTPGKCVFKDDAQKILESLAHTDLMLIVSPVEAGFITSEAKKALDRFIPVLLPYIKIYDGECHHVPRYDNKSSLGILLLEDADTDTVAREMIYEWMDRFAKNYHAQKVIKATANIKNISEVLSNEISNC